MASAPKGHISGRWAAFVAASACVGAWMTNVFAQWVMGPMMSAMSGGTSTGSAVASLGGIIASHPPIGVSTETVPLAAGVLAALAIVAKADQMRRENLSGKVDAATVHGEARWATPAELAGYGHRSTQSRDDSGKRVSWGVPAWIADRPGSSVEDDNYILSSQARLSISKNPNRYYERNKHVFVMAGSGAGKTWNFVQSNVLNMGSSLVFTDPKGEILERNGRFLEEHGYVIKVVNVKDEEGFSASNHYNPLHYATNATDVADIVDLLVKNTSSEESSHGDEFFEKAEKQLYLALLGFLFYEYKMAGLEQYCTIPQMIDLLSLSKQDPGAAKSQLDLVFYGTKEKDGYSGYVESLIARFGSEEAARRSPAWFPVTEYDGFSTTKGSPETIASIIASCYVRLAPFAISSVAEMFSDDDLELEKVGTRKTALFIVTSAQKGTYDFIAAMLLYQLFGTLTHVAEQLPDRHLPIPVCCYLDEVANIGTIPGLAKQVAFLRSYWVNLIIIVQSETDLERAYKKEPARSIRNNCDTTLYLGRCDADTCKKLSEEIGKTTKNYDVWSTTESRTGGSVSKNTQYVAEPLASADWLANVMPGTKCLVHFKQERWFLDDKADPMAHPRYAEWKATPPFDLAAWAARRASEAPAPATDADDEVYVYDADEWSEDEDTFGEVAM